MKANITTFAILSAVLLSFASGPALAQSPDDIRWINKCVADNKDEKQTQEVLLVYCGCMNNKMGTNETRSITEYEKTNPGTTEACSKQAGWKA